MTLTAPRLERILREHPRAIGPLLRAVYTASPWLMLYAIQAGSDGPVKIGVTKGQPRDRLRTLQVGNHEELRGLAAWRALPGDEKALHEQFAYAYIRGEWFRPVPELIEFVLWEGGEFCDWTPLTAQEREEFGL